MSEERAVELTNLDRVMWRGAGFTKGDLVAHYREVAGALLPHLAGRPLTLLRFPEGIDGEGFPQTQCRGRPPWMATRRITLADGRQREFCVADDEPSLLWLANQSAVELHTFLSRGPDLERPAAVAFDLDPGPEVGFLQVLQAALALRALLESLELQALPKTSGASGLHVLAPIEPKHPYEETKAFARALAERLAEEHPDRMTADVRAERRGRVLVDWLQNSRMRSMIAPYSLRATDDPGCSTPVSWEEIEAANTAGRPEGLLFSPADVQRRLREMGDLLEPVLTTRQSLPAR